MYNLNNKIREYILVTSYTIDVTYNKLSMSYYQKDQVNHVKCNGVISYHIISCNLSKISCYLSEQKETQGQSIVKQRL